MYKIYCQYEDYKQRVYFYVFTEDPDGTRHFHTGLGQRDEIKKYDPTLSIEEPTFEIHGSESRNFMQEMVDAIYKRTGIVPKEAPIDKNEMNAVKYHLEDMRKIAFCKTTIGIDSLFDRETEIEDGIRKKL